MTNITKAAPALDTPTLRELVTRLALEIDPEAKLEEFPEALAFQIDMARAVIRAALQDKAGEVPADFVPRLMAAVRIYQQQDYQAEEEASIADVAELYRAVCRIVGAAQPAPVVPDGFALVPLEPTEAMIVAAQCAYWPGMEVPNAHCITRALKAAMIAASQQKGGQRC